MIVRGLDERKGIAILTPEGPEDLITLRRLVEKGCHLKADTTRLIKPRGEYQRPDRGERVKVRITLEVERAELDGSLNRLRVLGRVVESSSDLVERGCHHSISISPGDTVGIRKEGLKAELLGKREEGLILVAIDYRSAGIGYLIGSGFRVVQEVRSGIGGKMYRSKGAVGEYLDKVVKLVLDLCRDCRVVVSGPFDLKLELAKRLKKIGYDVVVLEGLDVSGLDGVSLMVNSRQFRQALKGCRMAEIAEAMEEFSRRLYKSGETVALGFEEVLRASELGSVDRLLVSERAFRWVGEAELIGLIDRVERMGGKVYLVDESTSLGKQVSLNGGLIALLRYPIGRKTI
ncbi:MAG: pelota family protein [Thaumarchaeota archaeon]|nr:pelota family protein [Nitrososphaerota archaeon]